MNTALTVQDLALVFAVQRQDPTLLSPEFLSYSGIVRAEWEVAQQPIRTQQASQVRYQNGATIVAYPNQVVFAQSLNEESAVEIPGVAQRYAEVLRNMVFQSVGINVRGYVPFAGGETDAAREYLFNQLLAKGSWQEFGTEPVQAALNLSYKLERAQLNLSINEATLQLPEEQPFPVLLFVGNFNYPLKGESDAEKLHELAEVVSQWQGDLQTFKSLISEKFLGTAAPEALPSVFATAE
ncbi:MAG: hypothetical protein HC851_10830 [Acaryochloris sp. RU_4_1]|nr:hypothetical protein [Acaryochloris sp. RU_4_1]NJR54627.1 hypothetical protein [Acaryochloris sp. CRU_2_0]